MSKVKTITASTTEQEITLDATYQFVWFRNLGDNDCYVSDHSGIIAGADDVALCKAGGCVRITLPQAPMSNKAYIKAVGGSNTVEIHAQNFSDKPTAKTGKGGGQSITVEPLTVNDNGVYTAPTGKAYSPVTVDVQEEPWQPLQDGYSNFWFELTNDTLSPWLNFSAKNSNATIDWGDGSGEVALDTLTPTHTYSKAGQYIVKCKGVTGIGRQIQTDFNGIYFDVLKAVELSNEVTTLSDYCFRYYTGLKHIKFNSVLSIGTYAFAYCTSLNAIEFATGTTFNGTNVMQQDIALTSAILPSDLQNITLSMFHTCISLNNIIIPSTVVSISNNVFYQCSSLSEVHCQATVPPTLGTNVFASLPNNWICYVPVGYGDTYKAAEGWSTYADHIVEEGSQLTRSQLRNIELENTKKGSDDEWQR